LGHLNASPRMKLPFGLREAHKIITKLFIKTYRLHIMMIMCGLSSVF